MRKAHLPQFVLVMGVCGVGKSSVSRRLAAALDAPFVEGDDFHPDENKTRMAAGQPLTDAMRLPWLDAIADSALAQSRSGKPVVIACSALKQSYRERLRARLDDLLVIHLSGDAATIAARMAARTDHFMPQTMLASQLSDLEAPQPDEATTISIAKRPDEIVSDILRLLAAPGAASDIHRPGRRPEADMTNKEETSC